MAKKQNLPEPLEAEVPPIAPGLPAFEVSLEGFPTEIFEAEDKEKVEDQIKTVKDVLAKPEATKEEIETAAKTLSEEIQKVGAAMYAEPKPNEAEDNAEEKKSDAEAKPDDKKKAEEGEVVS